MKHKGTEPHPSPSIPQFTVYNPYTKEEEFTGTHDECQDFLGNYGGGWAALTIIPAIKAPSIPVKMTYKVVNNLKEMDFYTDGKEEALDVFAKYIKEYGDGIRLYEAIRPKENDEAPEWECIDHYDKEESSSIPVKEELLDIDKGNKLIAEFMGVELLYYSGESEMVDLGRKIVPLRTWAKYHSSWDRLMPVIEKIEEFTIDAYGTYVSIDNTECRIYNAGSGVEILSYNTSGGCKKDGWAESKMEGVWQSVVKFIQWYNLNAKTIKP